MKVLKMKRSGWTKLSLIILCLAVTETAVYSTVLVSNPCTSTTSDWILYNNDLTNPIQKEGYWLLDADAPSDIIQTPIIDAGNYTNLTLSFNISNFDNGAYNSALISYSTDGGSTWSLNAATSIIPASNSEFISSGDISLGTLNTKQLLIRISNKGTSGRSVKIKDILLTGSPIIIPPIANEPTNITSQSFTANWTKIISATGYILNVQKTNTITNETFNTIAASGSFVTSGSGASGTLNFGTSGWSAEYGYAAGGVVRIGTATSQGSLTTPILDLSGRFRLTFKSCAWLDDSKTINIILNDSIIQTASINNEATDDAGMKEYIIFGIGTGSDIIKLSATKASKNRFFIDDVRITKFEEIPGSPFIITSGETTNQSVASLSKGTYSYTVKAKDNNYTSDESNDIDVSVETTNGQVIHYKEDIKPEVYVTQNQIHISSSSPIGIIEVFNPAGIKIKQLNATESRIDITLNNGIYILRIGLLSMKIALL